jgi:hypothetical protein
LLSHCKGNEALQNKIEKMNISLIIVIFGAITFIIPLVQLSIGFKYVVSDGTSANTACQTAPDLPIIMGIGGIFALFYLGMAYGFIKMISSVNKTESDVAGHGPKILVGMSF